jgi:hypothetical protein
LNTGRDRVKGLLLPEQKSIHPALDEIGQRIKGRGLSYITCRVKILFFLGKELIKISYVYGRLC